MAAPVAKDRRGFSGHLQEALAACFGNLPKKDFRKDAKSGFRELCRWTNNSLLAESAQCEPGQGETSMEEKEYRYLATSMAGFVKQVASNYVGKGYVYFVQGQVPAGKDATAVDRKLLSLYAVQIDSPERWRRKQAGLANVHYIRFERDWLLVATPGKHKFFERESGSIRDVRECPIKFHGYSIRLAPGQWKKKEDGKPRERDSKSRVRVQISKDRYRKLKAEFLHLATHRTAEKIAAKFWTLPFEPYAPVRKQLLEILRQVNAKRKKAGYSQVSPSVIRYRQRPVKVFQAERAELPKAA